ncbi:MAG: hypothetical protein HQL95_02370 [Magnetococcales bacterium]|nr:hypothetical protein [Magnetococcales bacterium]
MTIRIPPRHEWFGDMEPEYEEIMEWQCRGGRNGGGENPDGLPLSWLAMIASRRSASVGYRLGA